MNTLLRNIGKRILRALSGVPEPVFTETQYREFFTSPVWLAFRYQVACRLDRTVDCIFTAPDKESICRAQGLVQGMAFVLAGEEVLRDLIESENTKEGKAALKESKQNEETLRKLLQLVEEKPDA